MPMSNKRSTLRASVSNRERDDVAKLYDFSAYLFLVSFTLVCTVCHQFADFLADRKMAMRGLSTIERAIQKVQSLPTQLTSLHSDLMMVSIGELPCTD